MITVEVSSLIKVQRQIGLQPQHSLSSSFSENVLKRRKGYIKEEWEEKNLNKQQLYALTEQSARMNFSQWLSYRGALRWHTVKDISFLFKQKTVYRILYEEFKAQSNDNLKLLGIPFLKTALEESKEKKTIWLLRMFKYLKGAFYS